jgi:MinD superfamily P-loop ATPase
MAPNIYWVGGGKGGVGKSMVSMALVDYLLGKGVPALFMESDTSNPDVFKTYRAALPSELVDLDHVDGWI